MPISKWIKDPFPSISHFIGAGLSVLALIVLLEASHGKPGWIVAFSIYGGSLILLYMASGIAHSIHASTHIEMWLDRFDYIAIFILIAGTYTPLCLIALHSPLGWGILTAEWLMAGIGISMIIFGPGVSDKIRSILYVIMGWLAILAAVPIFHMLSRLALCLLIGGGVIYSLGAVVFVRNRPHLWPGKFAAHDLWHCMVLAGSACHFFLMLCIISP
jgi:hemolysin III